MLLDNDGTLPLDSAADRTVAVIGPLADTLYTDWYSGALPYEVTPADGIRELLGDGATVRVSEGVDRIALRQVGTDKYVTGGTGADGAVLAANGTSASADAQFDVFEWGEGVVTLRNAANDKYVGFAGGPFRNDQAQPNGWFVQQQFKLEEQPDGTYVIRYAGYEKAYDWSGPNHYVTVAADGTLDARRRLGRPGSSLREGGGASTVSPRRSRQPRAPTQWWPSWAACRSSTAARTTTAGSLDLAAAQRRLVERGGRHEPANGDGAREQLSDHHRLGARTRCLRCCGPRMQGRRPATRWRTCSSATATRPGG